MKSIRKTEIPTSTASIRPAEHDRTRLCGCRESPDIGGEGGLLTEAPAQDRPAQIAGPWHLHIEERRHGTAVETGAHYRPNIIDCDATPGLVLTRPTLCGPIEKPHQIREQQDPPCTELVREDLKRAWLAHYGAPLYGESMLSGRAAPDLEKLVVDALALGRRDPSLTRALPVLLWRRRGDLDMAKLRRLARRSGARI